MICPEALSGPAVAGPRAPAPTQRGLGQCQTKASRAQHFNHEVLTAPFRLPRDSLPLPPSPSGFL